MIELMFSIIILILSVVAHEVSHGYVAYLLGDGTAEREGRLTLNPLKHLEIFGSFVLPIISYMSGGFILGWAKPVPYNPYNLNDQRWGEAKVAFAGPVTNFIIAIFFGVIIRYFGFYLDPEIISIFGTIIRINLVLWTFNLIPIPPLDGSKILFSLLPNNFSIRDTLEQYGMFLMLFFVFFLWKFILPVVYWQFYLITG